MKKTFFTAVLAFVSSFSQAQGFYDESTVQTIEIIFAQSNWDQLLDNAYATTEDYIMATSVTINGVVFDSVGVKYKGNSTYSANQVKNPFHIELDTYKDHEYQGYTDIKLSNAKNDPSFVREVMSYKIGRKYMDAPLSNFANVSVNGTLIGLYVSSESVSKKFLKNRFDSKNNTFVKCNPPAGAGPGSADFPNLVYLGTDSASYSARYEMKSDYGWKQLINLMDTLNNHVSDVSQILDIDRALWMLAFDNVLVNLDSYIGAFSQNYYLYQDDFNRFLPVIWDLNESFGKFSMTGSTSLNSTLQKQQMSHLLNANSTNYPLINKLLSVPMYKRMYLAHVKTILVENFQSNQFFTDAQAFHSTASASVLADPNKFYTAANFTSNLTTDVNLGGGPGGGGSVPGIQNLMVGRATHLLAQSDFTQIEPTISAVTESNSTPAVNDVLTFTANIINGSTVYLGYRTQNYAPFSRVLMYDDGSHNDGAANDGTFGADVTLSTSFFQYYIYAENSGIGKFSPVRAEHEYYEIQLSSGSTSGVVINEFLASNGSVQVDQDGQYDDWIELYNNSNTSVDLSGFYLSDDGADLTQWAFPAGTIIAANGYLIIWADNDLTQTGLHANFKLSASGETIYLMNGSAVEDQIAFGAQTTDISFGRLANGTGNFTIMTPTFSALNGSLMNLQNLSVDDKNWMVYPNPASDFIQLKTENFEIENEQLVIYNTAGKIVYSALASELNSLDIRECSRGMYIVKIGAKQQKLILK